MVDAAPLSFTTATDTAAPIARDGNCRLYAEKGDLTPFSDRIP